MGWVLRARSDRAESAFRRSSTSVGTHGRDDAGRERRARSQCERVDPTPRGRDETTTTRARVRTVGRCNRCNFWRLRGVPPRPRYGGPSTGARAIAPNGDRYRRHRWADGSNGWLAADARAIAPNGDRYRRHRWADGSNGWLAADGRAGVSPALCVLAAELRDGQVQLARGLAPWGRV